MFVTGNIELGVETFGVYCIYVLVVVVQDYLFDIPRSALTPMH
jgi:hypothetical protein